MNQLSLYNSALLLCGERFLSSLTDNTEGRRLLDHVWSTGGVKACLEQGQWHFAMRTVQIDFDPSVEPTFGYRRAFQKPNDWVNTSAVCSDEFFRTPLTRYVDEAGFWYSDLDTIYVRYVSMGSLYGYDLNKWPESFSRYVEAYFASRIIKKISSNEEEEAELLKMAEHEMKRAKNKAAMAEPTSFPARGAWVSSRLRYPNRRDGGGNTNLIG